MAIIIIDLELICNLDNKKPPKSFDLSGSLNRGRGIRTPINGFGDRCSAVELFPFALLSCCLIDFYILAQEFESVNKKIQIF